MDVLDVLPAVNVAQLDLGCVGNAWMKRLVVIVAEDGRVTQINLWFEFLPDEVGDQICIPIGLDFTGTIATGDGGSGANRSTSHGNFVVLFIRTGHVERHTLLV